MSINRRAKKTKFPKIEGGASRPQQPSIGTPLHKQSVKLRDEK
jgi:hypothetical protein